MADKRDIEKRQQCERRCKALEGERSSFDSHWRELSDFILPRRSRFVSSDRNKGDKRNQKIVDGTATDCADVLEAGLMTGVTNAAQGWFKLGLADSDLAEVPAVKSWLYDVQHGMESLFLRSNLYQVLPTIYSDVGVFATGVIGAFEDDEEVIRFYDYPLGSFCLGLDGKRRVRIFSAVCDYTVEQVVDLWGGLDPKTGKADFERGEPTNLSTTVQNAWARGNREQWVTVWHLIQPNTAFDGVKIESKYKRYESLYFEAGQTEAGFLEHKGYDEFPILAGRWKTSGQDVYGTDCPGMRALPDIKQLQYMEKQTAKAIEKMINPPLVGPGELRNQRVSSLPGDITYTNERDGIKGLRPMYEVNFDIADAEAKSEQKRQQISRTFKVDLFLMLASSDRRQFTATEILERKDEKLTVLGPMYGRFSADVLGPLIDRTYAVMDRARLVPPPPPELDNVLVNVEFMSPIAQALKAVKLGGLDRLANAVVTMVPAVPDVLDRFDVDEWIGEYADGADVPPTVLRSLEDAKARRDARNQAAAQAQGVQNLGTAAGAARDLGNAPVDGPNALAKLVDGMRTNAAQTQVQ